MKVFVKILSLSGILLAMLSGCGKELTIHQYPPFWTPDFKSVAVVPFRGEKGGEAIAEELANSLRANATYQVFSPADVQQLASMQDLQIAFGSDEVAMAAQVRSIDSMNVQAIISGSVTTYGTTTRNEQRQEPVMVYDSRLKKNVATGQYRRFTVTRHDAHVAATAALLTPDGSTIYATPQPASWQQYAEGSPPSDSAHGCLAVARSKVVAQLVEHFAIVKKKIKVKPDETLIPAGEYFEGKWDKRKKFEISEPAMKIVLALPPECDRNTFRIAISSKDSRAYIAEEQITWSRQIPSMGHVFEFVPAEIAWAGVGEGKYTVKLFSGTSEQPSFEQDFELVHSLEQ